MEEKDILIGHTVFRTAYIKCKYCGKPIKVKIINDCHLEGEIKYADGKEIHLGPDGETWHFEDGGMVGYGGYEGI